MQTVKQLTSTRFTVDKPGKIGFYKANLPQIKNGQFLVETLYTGVSAGTDLSHFMGTNPKHTEIWNASLRLFQPGSGHASEEYPLASFGDMQVGRVVESRAAEVPVGSIIAKDYGHRSHQVLSASEGYTILPASLSPVLGIYVAKNGPVAANGILYAANELSRRPIPALAGSLAGQRIAVIGAGVIGLLTATLAQWAGAREVAVIDIAPDRLDIAAKLGLVTVNSREANPALVLKNRWQDEANALNTGADFVFQCTGSDIALAASMGILREQGTVIDMGFYPGGAAALHLGKEFHHNRLRHICAQIGAVPREQEPRWNRQLLTSEVIAFLGQRGSEIEQHFITHRLPFSEAQSAYDALKAQQPGMLQVVLSPDEAATDQAKPDPSAGAAWQRY